MYSSPNIMWVIKSRRMGCVVHVGHMEQKCTQGFGGETERKRPLGGPRNRWEVNIKMDLQELGC